MQAGHIRLRHKGPPTGLEGTILLVDNSHFFAGMVASAIGDRLGLKVAVADSLAAARREVERHAGEFILVLSGLILPDAQEFEVVDYFTGQNLPLVVVTAIFDAITRERILAARVIDYVLKDNPASVDYIVWLVERVVLNRGLTALVVDDMRSWRRQVSSLLSLYGFNVVEAENGEQALAHIKANPSIRLLVTDFEMPGMNGIELIRRVRATHRRDRLAIIGMSASESSLGPISPQFIKSGANDFLAKPFLPEELFCRVAQNVESLERIGHLHRLATTDYLTGLFNRRSFFETAPRLFAEAAAQGRALIAAMADIDFFKRINDTYGHDAGDAVLRAVANTLATHCGEGGVVARFGGEEFCMLLPQLPEAEAAAFFERLRAAVEGLAVTFGNATIAVTSSFGICTKPQESLTATLSAADQALYLAKDQGRNRVEFAG
jgi:diguanylate cyclase (GGDEF)-like protein